MILLLKIVRNLPLWSAFCHFSLNFIFMIHLRPPIFLIFIFAFDTCNISNVTSLAHSPPFWINWDTYPHCSAFLYLEMLRQVCTYREIFQYNLIACKLSPRRLVVFKEQCIQIILLKAFYLLYFFLQITHFFLWARTHLSARLHLSDIYKNVTVIWNIIIWASTFIPVQKWGNTTFIFWYFYT